MDKDFNTTLKILNKNIAETDKAIYAWTANNEIVRIGTSTSTLEKRISSAARWIEVRLKDTVGTKNPQRREKEYKDALRWKQILIDQKAEMFVWGRQGTIVKTPVGSFSAYLAEENILLSRHKPILNNSHFR